MSGLSNADFRSLLNSDGPAAIKSLETKKRPTGTGGATLTAAKKDARKAKYLKLQNNEKRKAKRSAEGEVSADKDEEEEDDAEGYKANIEGTYVDRAEQRRAGGEEYTKVAEEFDALNERPEDESKFLGGDVSHTHLVKGLDYALLAKVRGELQEKVDAPSSVDPGLTENGMFREQPAKDAEVADVGVDSVQSAIGSKILETIQSELHPHHQSFQQKLDKIDRLIFQGANFKGNTTSFLPGRMVYEFHLKEEDKQEDDINRPDVDYNEWDVDIGFNRDFRPCSARESTVRVVTVFYSQLDSSTQSNPEVSENEGSVVACVQPEIINNLRESLQKLSTKAAKRRKAAINSGGAIFDV